MAENEQRFGLTNIFTDKTVGIAFAAAFASWAWMLNNMSGDILQKQEETQNMLLSIERQMMADRVTSAQAHAEFREQIRQHAVSIQRLEQIYGSENSHNNR